MYQHIRCLAMLVDRPTCASCYTGRGLMTMDVGCGLLCLLLHLLLVSERNVGPHESMYGSLRGGPEALLW
jgi:hypothetical protein